MLTSSMLLRTTSSASVMREPSLGNSVQRTTSMLGPLPDLHYPAASQPLQMLDDDIQMYIKPCDSADGGKSAYSSRVWGTKQGEEERGEASSYHPSQRGRHGSSGPARASENSSGNTNADASAAASSLLFGFSDGLGSLTPLGQEGSAILASLAQPGGLTVEGMSNIWPAYEESTWYGPRGPPRRPAGEAVTEPLPSSLLHPFVSFMHAEQRATRQASHRPRPSPASSTTAAVPLPMPPPPQDSQATATAMSQDYPTGPYLSVSQRSGLGMGLASQDDSTSSQSGAEVEVDGDMPAQAPPPAVAAMIRHAFGAEMMRLGKDLYTTEAREAPASHAFEYAAWKQSVKLPPHILAAITNSDLSGLAGEVGHSCMASLFDIRDTHSLNNLGFSSFVLNAMNARRAAILAANAAATAPPLPSPPPPEPGVPTSLPADPIGVDKVHTATSLTAMAAERTAPPTIISGLGSPLPSTATGTGTGSQAGKLASPISPGDASLLIHVASTNTVINGQPNRSPPSSEVRAGLPIATPIKGAALSSSSAPNSAISDSTGSTPASGGKGGAATHERGATSPELLLSMQFGAAQAAAVAPTHGAPEVSPGQASTPHLAMMLDEMRERERVDYPAGMSPDSASAAAALDAFTRRGFAHTHPKFTFSPQRNNRSSPKRPKPTTPSRTLSDNLKMATSRKLMLNEIDSGADLPLAGVPLPVFVSDVRTVADRHGVFKDSIPSILLVGARASTSVTSVMNAMNDLCRDSEELHIARANISNDRVNTLAGVKRKADPGWGEGPDAKRPATASADRFPQLSRPRRSNRSTGRTGYSHIIAKHAAAARVRTRGTLTLRTGPIGLSRIAPVSVLATSFQLMPRLSAIGATLTTAAAPLLSTDLAITRPSQEYNALVARAQERLKRVQPPRRARKVRRRKAEETDEDEEEEDEDDDEEEEEEEEEEEGDDGRQLTIPLQKVFAHHVDGRVLDVNLSGSVRLHKALTSSLFAPEEILRPASRPLFKPTVSDPLGHPAQGVLSPLPSAARVSAAEAMVDLVSQHADAPAGVSSSASAAKSQGIKPADNHAAWTPAENKSRSRPTPSHPGQDHAMPGDHDDAITAGLIASAKRTRAPFDPFQDTDDAPPSASGRVGIHNQLDGILGSPFREFSGLQSSRDDDHLLSSPGRRAVAPIKYDMSPPPSLRRTSEHPMSGERSMLSPAKPLRHETGLDRRETPLGSRSAFRSSPQRSPGLMELPAHTSVASIEGSPASLWLTNRTGQPDTLQHSPASSSHLVSSLPVAIPLNALPNVFSNAHKAASASSHPMASVRIPVNGLLPSGARLDSLPTPATGAATDPKHMTPGDFLSKDEPN